MRQACTPGPAWHIVGRTHCLAPAGRPFDFKAYHTRYVALEIAYLGWDYHGFASQADTDNTIEVGAV